MHYDDLKRPTPTHGIIVLDTCSLLALSLPVPNSLLAPPPSNATVCTKSEEHPKLIDALFLLAQHGFEIVIPEMVAIEAGRFLRDSQSLFKYFNNDINPFFALTKDFISAIPKCVGNIRIVPPHKDDNSPPATHIRELWTTHSSPHSNSYKCTAIARMDRKTPTPQRKDWGDIAAQQMIKFMTIPQGIPVFYLSDDALAYDRIAQTTKKTSVHRLTSGSFVEALHQASLLPVIGIKDAPYSRIRTTIPPFTNCRLLQNAFPKLVDPFVARLAGIKEAAEAKMPAPTIAPSDPADRKRMENTWGKRGWKSLGSSRSKPQPVPP